MILATNDHGINNFVLSRRMNTPEISVVIPAYNAVKIYYWQHYLGVGANTLPTGKLIVVDDGSTDNTAEVVTTFLSTLE